MLVMTAFVAAPVFSQSIIGGNFSLLDPSAMLQINSTSRGFLPPRLTTTQRDAISSPATGLTVYNTTTNQLEVNIGTPSAPSWAGLSGVNVYNSNGNLTGNRTVTLGANNLTFSSTTGNLIFNPSSTGRLGIGTASPGYLLHVNGTAAFSSLSSGSSTDSLVVADPTTGQLKRRSVAALGSISLATGTTGTDVNVSGSPASLGGTLTLNIPDASATARGLVTTGTQTLAGAKTFTGTVTLPGGGVISSFTNVGTSTWINLPTTGPAGIGTGGAGVNAWIGYAQNAGHWFTNSSTGDIAYRNTSGRLLWGNTIGAASMALRNDSLGIGTVTPAFKLDVNGTMAVRTLSSGSSTDSIVVADPSTGLLKRRSVASLASGSAWSLTGNAGTTAGTNFIGTTDNTDVIFKRNNVIAGWLEDATTGSANTSFGENALTTRLGYANTAVGALAINSPTSTSARNVAIGAYAGRYLTDGQNNVAIGFMALTNGSTALQNVILGDQAGNSINTGNGNILIGFQAGGGASSPNSVTTGSNNIVIGKNQLLTSGTSSNQLNIGGAIFGTGLTGTYAAPAGNIGIGTASPGSTLDVKGTLRLSGSTSGYVGFAPAAAAGSTTYTLPDADGTSGQVLSTNGSGTLSWATASSSNIYTANGTLSGARTVTLSGNNLTFINGGSNILHINAGAGAVGIGNTAPSEILHVTHPGSSGAAWYSVFLGQNSTGNKNAFRARVMDNLTDLAADYVGGNNATSLTFSTRTSGGSLIEKMRVDANGTLAIGTTTPDANAILDVTSTTKGLLMPRIALTGITSASPLSAFTAGMVVYNTATAGTSPNNVTPGFYVSDGSKWIALADNRLRFFYSPTIAIPLTATGTGFTYNLYQNYSNQFSTPAVKSTGAATSIPVFGSSDLSYYITAYDTNVLSNVSINSSGVMTYDVISLTTSGSSYINVVFTVK